MDAMTALTSVLADGAFEADVNGNIVGSNAPFVHLLRRIPGDDWRNGVAEEDRPLVDAFWNALFLHPEEDHEPISFRVLGGEGRHQLQARTVTKHGQAVSAVGLVQPEEDATNHIRFDLDPATGLPDRHAVLQRIDELSAQHREFTLAVVVLAPEDAGAEIRRKEAARQLLSVVRPDDVVAASADGTFLICASDLKDLSAAGMFAQRASDALRSSELHARIGVNVPVGEAAAATLVREAEAGAYAAEPGEVGFAR